MFSDWSSPADDKCDGALFDLVKLTDIDLTEHECDDAGGLLVVNFIFLFAVLYGYEGRMRCTVGECEWDDGTF
jgi:hypothetical protein